jgi:hypothetical protein
LDKLSTLQRFHQKQKLKYTTGELAAEEGKLRAINEEKTAFLILVAKH